MEAACGARQGCPEVILSWSVSLWYVACKLLSSLHGKKVIRKQYLAQNRAAKIHHISI